MVMGVPLVPITLITTIFVMLMLYTVVYGAIEFLLVLVAMYVCVYGWMRAVSRSDEHTLGQVIMRWALRGRIRNTKFWGAASLSPVEFKRWKH